MRYLKTNTATRVTVGPFLDKTDGITPEVALTVTSEKLTFIVDDGGVPTLVLDVAPTASGGANDMVHITGDDSGYYDLELAAANVNYLGRAVLSLNDVATHLPVFHEFMILSAQAYDSLMGTGNLSADVKAITAGVDFSATMKASIETACDATVGGGTGTALTAIPWNAAWDAEVQSEVFDALDAAFTDATGLTANGLLDRIRTLGWILRNKIAVTDANGNTIIYKDDSTTAGFTVNAMLTDDSTTTTRLRAA